MTQGDDMSDDLYAHGARELVLDIYAADNPQRRLGAHCPDDPNLDLCPAADDDHAGHNHSEPSPTPASPSPTPASPSPTSSSPSPSNSSSSDSDEVSSASGARPV